MEEKDVKLVQAKHLLKKYQNKVNDNHLQMAENGIDGYPRYMNGGDSHSDLASVSSRASSAAICDQASHQFNNQNSAHEQEIAYWKKLTEDRDKSLSETVDKLHNLQTHYAELHAAYSAVTQATSSTAPTQYADQINKLQSALSVAIEEKTSYQGQLRAMNSRLQTLEADNKDMHGMLQITSNSSSMYDSEKKHLYAEVETLTKQLKDMSEEVERLRSANAAFESKTREFYQDRTDMQARLKYIYKERDDFEQQLAQAKHDLEMKEIFIKQLTYADPTQGAAGQQELQTLAQEKQRLVSEMEQMNLYVKEAQRKQETNATYYQSCLNELHAKISQLEEKLRLVSNEKSELEAAKNSVEDKLSNLLTKQASAAVLEMNHQANQPDQAAHNSISTGPQFDAVEVEALRNSISAMQVDYARATDRIREVDILVQEKDFMIGQLEKQLAAEENRCQSLRNEIENIKTIGTDVSSLLEQLQNEKATVSRAIAQNMELKEQLIELQDKFVEVTNEGANREDQRQAALVTIGKLQGQLDSMIQERNNPYNVQRFEVEAQTESSEEKTQSTIDTEQQTEFSFAHSIATHAQENFKTESEHMSEASTEQVTDSRPLTGGQNGRYSRSSSSSSISACSLPRDSVISQLEAKLECVANEKKEIQVANDKLQYFLTALESENESIGEYIALYRFQRQNIQKKLAEKEALVSQLTFEKTAAQSQVSELQRVLYDLFGQSPPVLTADGDASISSIGTQNGSEPQDQVVEKLNKILTEIQNRRHQCQGSSHAGSNDFSDPKLHCPECRGQMFTL